MQARKKERKNERKNERRYQFNVRKLPRLTSKFLFGAKYGANFFSNLLLCQHATASTSRINRIEHVMMTAIILIETGFVVDKRE